MKKLFPILVIFLVLVACNPIQKIEQPTISQKFLLTNQGSIGQTFVARYDGLQAILIHLEPDQAGMGTIQLILRSSPESTTDLRSSELPIGVVDAPGLYRFQFPPLSDSNQKYYYAQIDIIGTGSLSVGAASGNAYLNGALHLDQIPQEAQSNFSLEHNLWQASIGLVEEVYQWVVLLIVSGLLFIIPGWALLCLVFPRNSQQHWLALLGISGALSLAIYPLLFLWTNLVGLRLGALSAWLPMGSGIIILLWHHRQEISTIPQNILSRKYRFPSFDQTPWAGIGFLVVILLILATRFWAARGLEAPMWGDSYQHSVIAQLIVENGGLFDSWQPYAEMTTFTYHFGFHSAVAVFHWLTRLPSYLATLYVGQIMNALAVILLAGLVFQFTRNLWSVVICLMIAGLLVPMPMYYVNWGRYTQLAGQVMLPGLVSLMWITLEEYKPRKGLFALSGMILCGLALTHYRIALFGICAYLAHLLVYNTKTRLPTKLRRVLWIALITVVLFLPWFFHMFTGWIPAIARNFLFGSAKLTTPLISGITQIGDVSQYLSYAVWLILLLTTGWGLWRRERWVAFVSIWWFINFVITNPQMFMFPGPGVISNFTLFIAAYIPASIIIGGICGKAIHSINSGLYEKIASGGLISKIQSKYILPSMAILVVALSLWGARQRMWDVIPPTHALITRPDLNAISWIKENIPAEETFLLNAQFAFGNTLVVGTDGGWWLPLLSHRQTNLPPINYGTESGPSPDYITWVNALVQQIQQSGFENPQTLQMLHDRGIGYIFSGQQKGMVNSPTALIQPEELISNPFFRPVYHKDRVWIFELTTP